MGILKDQIELNTTVYGNIVDQFKENSLFFYDKYGKSDKQVTNIPVGKMQIGGFYFLHYHDDSNWMKWSPIFTVDFKKFQDMIVIYGVNFNFIPLELRVAIFDQYITEKDYEDDNLLSVDYKGMYAELMRLGFEYAIVEYNLKQVELVHKISIDMVPRFLYSQHPRNKYDPDKLMEIWTAKIDGKADRHAEILQATVKDFFSVTGELLEKYSELKDHMTRVQNSFNKYGK
jgi:hypothetical protein